MAPPDLRALERAFDLAKKDQSYTVALDELSDSWPRLVGTIGLRIRQLLDSAPHDLWHSDPWLVTCYAASFRSVEATSRATALPYFEAARALLEPTTPALVRVTYHVHHAAALRSVGRLDDALAAISLASSIAESADSIPLSKHIRLRAEIALHRGAIYFHCGDFDRAKVDYRLAGSLAEANLSIPDQLDVFGGLALIQFLRGENEHALTYVSRAEATGATTALRNSRFSAPALLTELLITVNQEGARAAEGKIDRVKSSIGESEWEPLGLYAQAYAELFKGRPHEGLDLLRSSLHALDDWKPIGFAATEISGLRAAAFLQLGDPGAAWDILAQLTPTQHHTVCPNRLVAHLRFITGDYRGTLDAVHECEILGDSHSSRTLADVFLVKAAALLCLGKEEKSDVAFDRSLRIAARNRMQGPFRLVPSDTVQSMLTRAAIRNQPREVEALVKRLDGLTVALRPQESPSLSDRERAIARELVRGNSPNQIAEDLYISVNTVKSHLKNIYRKLGVSSRSEAIHHARELGLQVEFTRD